MKSIFKIVLAAEWREAERTGQYCGSAKNRVDGFLHFSTAEQVPHTLKKHYAGLSDLLLICVDADRLGPALKREAARDGQLYPHLYGSLSLSAVAWARSIVRHADGSFVLPAQLDTSAT